ncbi:MAG: RNA 3'-terminal phosphate cyclase [Emcibacteraceae bacterium]|nr:RNA 3'-terminal phosphate cyclase [Emcibacteraceae bacterium]
MIDNHIIIDGSKGEGGGQILRSSLSLSMITGRPFTLKNIRAGREKPGLMRQHLTCVKAAAEVCDAEISDVTIGSEELSFMPGKIKAGDYHFAIGTAGSTTLVAQTLIPALMFLGEPSSLKLEGGTHNMKSPPYDFIEQSFLPLLNRMGANISCGLQSYGFSPAGGGQISIDIKPSTMLKPIELTDRGKQVSFSAEAIVSKIPISIAERELKKVQAKLGWSVDMLKARTTDNSIGPGNILLLKLVHDHVTEVYAGFGVVGTSAESIAKKVCKSANRYLNSEAAVGPYLADQLLLPMAVGGVVCIQPCDQAFTQRPTSR